MCTHVSAYLPTYLPNYDLSVFLFNNLSREVGKVRVWWLTLDWHVMVSGNQLSIAFESWMYRSCWQMTYGIWGIENINYSPCLVLKNWKWYCRWHKLKFVLSKLKMIVRNSQGNISRHLLNIIIYQYNWSGVYICESIRSIL